MCWQTDSCSELVTKGLLLDGFDDPLCKECTNPRGHEDSRLVAAVAYDEAIGRVRSILTNSLLFVEHWALTST